MAGVEGRVALITGGSRGIGRATADILASRGARVMCIARSRQELEATGHDYSLADLGTPEGCAQAVADTEQRLGPIEIFICNHGIGSAHERVVWEQEPEVWSETMRINLDVPSGSTSKHGSGWAIIRPVNRMPVRSRDPETASIFSCLRARLLLASSWSVVTESVLKVSKVSILMRRKQAELVVLRRSNVS